MRRHSGTLDIYAWNNPEQYEAEYQCVASNMYGSAYSNKIRLRLHSKIRYQGWRRSNCLFLCSAHAPLLSRSCTMASVCRDSDSVFTFIPSHADKCPFHDVASSLCVSVGAPVWPREIIEPVVISAGLPLVLSCDPPPGPPKPETYWMSSCKWVFKRRDIGNSWHQQASVLLQVHMRDPLTGQSRRPSPPCRRCGRTAGCPWV